MDDVIKAVMVVVVALGALVGISLLLSIPVWLLWNGCLVGAIDGVREITWLQSWGIMILFGFLFKNTSVSTNKN
jgi:hypothetical protein